MHKNNDSEQPFDLDRSTKGQTEYVNDPIVEGRLERQSTSKQIGLFAKIGRYFFQNISEEKREIDNTGNCIPQNFMSNKINNRKYNVFTLLPLFLFNEYKHFSNFYFLVIALTQFIDIFKVGLIVTYIGPIIVVTSLSLLKEIWDEIKRKKKDDQINTEVFIKLIENGEKEIQSQDIKVGDILRIYKDQRVPADLILLYTSEELGTAFVRTDQLDGETDWKVREAVKSTHKMAQHNFKNLINHEWTIVAEKPNDQIYNFTGSFEGPDGFEALKLQHTIWANMKVASGEILGLVVYTGNETKMSLNSKQPQTKYGKTDEEVNFMTITLFIVLFVITLCFAIISGKITDPRPYIFIIKVFLIFSTIIPISLKVNVEFAKFYYTILINKDEDIAGTIARSSNIPEELGRIQYLLSDKTGTLTRNEMIFKHFRTPQGNFSEDNFQDLKQNLKNKDSEFLQEAFKCFILCNNVSPVIDDGKRELQAASPDEVALVKFAEEMNYEMIERNINSIKIKTPQGIEEVYEILYDFPFNSETKRMGIILREKINNKIYFFLKGADSMMRDKIQLNKRDFIDEEAGLLSSDGFRTLVLGYKILTEDQLKTFSENFQKAGQDFQNREQKERQCIENLEDEVQLLGVTGVEDLLQEDIKSIILSLREAEIKVWMLTGDKLETAKCIAISTGFKKNNQKFYVIDETDQNKIQSMFDKLDPQNDALIVTGRCLEKIFSRKQLTKYCFNKAALCQSVILCRCAPKQKAEVTLYIKNQLKKVVCGIGDGGNDVGMIQCSSVGIGIEGKEGKQASLASDFSVLKFKYILKLFIWHGRLSYIRTSLLSNFVIHRGFVITVLQAMFMATFYFITIDIYNGYLIMCYATVFTNFPVFSLILDEDIPINLAFNYPKLYCLVQEGKNLSFKVFMIWIWKSIFQASIIFILGVVLFNQTFLEITTITFTALIITEYLNIYTAIRKWHYLIGICLLMSLAIYIFCLIFMRKLFLFSSMDFEDFCKIVFLSICSWLPIQIGQTIQRLIWPSQVDKVIREQKTISKRKQQELKFTNKSLELVNQFNNETN